MGLDRGVAVPPQAGIAGLAAFGLDESPAADWGPVNPGCTVTDEFRARDRSYL
jgi:hypothetical protein